MDWITIAILGYVLLQVGFGFIVTSRIHSEEDYLVAGRTLGLGISAFTIFATWFGAETCIGAAGAAYEGGLAATRADPFGYSSCLILMGLVFAGALYRRKLFTLADLMRQRYGVATERLAVLLLVPTSVLWAAAQIRAFGQILSASSDISVNVSISIAATVVIVYTAVGGILADAISDVFQGIVLMIGLSVLAVVLYTSLDADAIAQGFNWERMRFRSPGESMLSVAETWAVPIIGSVAAQELVARVVSARSESIARRACLIGGGMYFLTGLIPLSIGLLGPTLIPGLENPEQILVQVAQHYLPAWLYVLLAGALVSAILSTVDSALLVSGSLVAHNLILPMSRPDVPEKRKILINRCAVAICGIVAYVIALAASGVYDLVIQASAFGTAGTFVVVVFGLFTNFGGARSAIASLVLGFATYVGTSLLIHEFPAPFLTSLVVAFCAYICAEMYQRLVRVSAGTG